MTIGIMQPYFMPYIGYWQLMAAVDRYVVYDNIQYSKGGWINRNRMLQNGKDVLFTIPLKKDSDYLDVCQREISSNFDQQKLLNQIVQNYRKAPFFEEIYPIIHQCVICDEVNLFNYIFYSLIQIRKILKIESDLIVSSQLPINHDFKGQDKVLAICKEMKANQYVNAIGGQELYDKKVFEDQGIKLNFLRSNVVSYSQYKNDFVSNLSIIDVLMFNGGERTRQLLKEYTLI